MRGSELVTTAVVDRVVHRGETVSWPPIGSMTWVEVPQMATGSQVTMARPDGVGTDAGGGAYWISRAKPTTGR